MPNLLRSEERALASVDVPAAVRLLCELLAVPSVSGSDAECEIQHLMATKAAELDLDVDLWPLDLPALATMSGFPGVEAARTEAWGLVASWPGETDPPSLVLQGHVDVVPAGDLHAWGAPPFEPQRVGGRVHGRGACDMKAGVAANIAALMAVKEAGISPRETLALHFVVGEEDGGVGAFGTLARGHRGRACVITEPTGGTLVTANAGALTFTLEVPGLATHASTAYAGRSAIDGYWVIHRALQELETSRNRSVSPLMSEYPVAYPVSVGRLSAGDWASSVPDLLVAEGRLGVALGEDPAAARLELEEAVAAAASTDSFLSGHPPRVRWLGGQFASGQLTDGVGLRDLVADAHADVHPGVPSGERPRERGAPYGSDLRLYQAAGIPTLHYGPGDVRLAHGPRESVAIRELETVIEVLVLCILRTCGAC